MEKNKIKIIIRGILLCTPLWAPPLFLSFYSCMDKHLCMDGVSNTFYVFVSATLISFAVAVKNPVRRKAVFILPIACFLVILYILVSFFFGMGRGITLDALYSNQKNIQVENLKATVNENGDLPVSIMIEYDISSKDSFHGRFYPYLELETSRLWQNGLNHYTESLVRVSGDITPEPEILFGENLRSDEFLLGDYGYKKGVKYHFRVNFMPAFIVGGGVNYKRFCFNTQDEYVSENIMDASREYSVFFAELPDAGAHVESNSFKEFYDSYEKQGLPQCLPG